MVQTLALIDYGSGNTHSARRALQAANVSAGLDFEIRLTDNPETILKADRIVLPGVGHFATCMKDLTAREGVVSAMSESVLRRGVPFLGICVGMQILAKKGSEGGDHSGLGWVEGSVDPLRTGESDRVRIPHMGWNKLEIGPETHALLCGLGDDPHVYFVHSYALDAGNKNTIAHSSHGQTFAAAVAHENIAGTQFHPEKSQKAGLQILQNFLQWIP